MDDNILVNLINDTNKLLEEKQRQLDISNQQLKLGELLNNDLQKEVDRLNEELNNSKSYHCPHFLSGDSGYVVCHHDKEKENSELRWQLNKTLEVIRFYALINNYDFRQVGTTTYATKIKSDIETSYDTGYKLLVSGKKAREFLQRMERK